MSNKILLSEDFIRYNDQELSNNQLICFIQKIVTILSNSGLFAIINHRFGVWVEETYGESSNRIVRFCLKLLYHLGKKVSLMWAKVYILNKTSIGPGLYISNKGGVIIGAESIGDNCTIGSSVTIGLDIKKSKSNFSQIGNSVTICDNCLVYGGITVGNDSVISEKSVLSKTIPDNVKVIGNPARIVSSSSEPSL